MPSAADPPGRAPPRFSTLIGALVLLVGAGGVLWWLRGEAVFSDTVLSALAWCF